MKIYVSFLALVFSISACSPATNETNQTNSANRVPKPAVTPLDYSNTAAPVEKTDVLAEIIKVENDWKAAKMKRDGAALEKIFADEFVNVDDAGKKYSKKEWIAAILRFPVYSMDFKIEDAKLVDSAEDKATVSFTLVYTLKNGKVSKTRETDNFVRRDGRWQVVSSKSTAVK